MSLRPASEPICQVDTECESVQNIRGFQSGDASQELEEREGAY